MRSMLRQFRRAPGRIIASVFALALAVGAIGVLAIPTISEGTLHEAVGRDGLPDIIVGTTPLTADQIADVAALEGVAAAEAQNLVAVDLANGFPIQLVGLDFDSQTMDLVQLTAGTYPADADEVVASPLTGAIGTTFVASGRAFEIVGHGTTFWWSDSPVVFAPLDTTVELADEGGTNRLVVTAVDDGKSSLRSIAGDIRETLATKNDTFTTFPRFLPDGSTPIDEDINQVSTLIGLLGVFAGLVALVLLGSTTNTLISERTREVAVMRALGGRPRPLRRRLRRIATGITALALLIGLPFGVFVSNLIARMVLREFVGITPGVAVDWWVVAGSAVGMLLGARLVAARAARRITQLPLAEALRDRDGLPFGRRWAHRLAIRVPGGGLFGRLATRASVRRPAHTLAVVVQVSAAVGAAFLIPSLTASVNAFNSATSEPWLWESVTTVRGDELALDDSIADGRQGVEAGIWIDGEIEDWDVDVFGLSEATTMFDPMLTSGIWMRAGSRDAVLSRGFAERNSIEIGDTVTLELAAGAQRYDVVGQSDDAARAIYLDRAVLADGLGAPGRANVVWSDHASLSLPWGADTSTTTAADLAADDAAGRDAIVLIFGAIGVIVASVAGLAVLSSMTISLFERRHELAALQAVGASRHRLRGLVIREVMPVAAVGIAVGLALGALGTRGIIGSFEASNAVEIGVVDATGAIPAIVIGAFAALILLALLVVRSATRRPITETLRGAA